MGPASKWEYVEAFRIRYRKAKAFEKTWLLTEFCKMCRCHRKHAIRLLNRRRDRPRRKPGRRPLYGPEVLGPLKTIWLAAEQMCSKRLRVALALWLPAYERHHGPLDPSVRKKLLALSPATIDRLLRPIRARRRPRGLCATRPGTLLRNQIPIRAEPWDVDRPGYLEADTVAHCGTSLAGSFIWSLTFTDIWSGWTENRAVWNKGAHGVVTQVRDVESRLVFPILGFDCDNGAEFLNHHLWSYFARRKNPVAFTRSRPYHRNDNAHVEQKQWTHVRQLLGYDRLENPAMLEPLNDLYTHEWSLLQNFFCPTLKLKSKTRVKSRYQKRYYPPQTPYQRLMGCPTLPAQAKQRLRRTHETLDPFALKKAIERKLRRVFMLRQGTRSEVTEPSLAPLPG